jgi:predicted nucleic acid-binding protein
MSVFVDTGAFLAYRNKRDKYHEVALNLFMDALKRIYGQNIQKVFWQEFEFYGCCVN